MTTTFRCVAIKEAKRLLSSVRSGHRPSAADVEVLTSIVAELEHLREQRTGLQGELTAIREGGTKRREGVHRIGNPHLPNTALSARWDFGWRAADAMAALSAPPLAPASLPPLAAPPAPPVLLPPAAPPPPAPLPPPLPVHAVVHVPAPEARHAAAPRADHVDVREGPEGTWTIRPVHDPLRLVQLQVANDETTVAMMADRLPHLSYPEWVSLFRTGCAALRWPDPFAST